MNEGIKQPTRTNQRKNLWTVVWTLVRMSQRKYERTMNERTPKQPTDKNNTITAKERDTNAYGWTGFNNQSYLNVPMNYLNIFRYPLIPFPVLVCLFFCFFFSQSQAEMDKLTCYYYNKHPLLVIRPVKIEMASFKPNIYLLHDIIRDEDIEFIKDLAAPRVCTYVFINSFIHPSIPPSIHPSIYLSIYLSIHPFIHSFI